MVSKPNVCWHSSKWIHIFLILKNIFPFFSVYILTYTESNAIYFLIKNYTLTCLLSALWAFLAFTRACTVAQAYSGRRVFNKKEPQ